MPANCFRNSASAITLGQALHFTLSVFESRSTIHSWVIALSLYKRGIHWWTAFGSAVDLDCRTESKWENLPKWNALGCSPVLFSVHAYANSVVLMLLQNNLHFTRNTTEKLLSLTVSDLGEKICPLKTEQSVQTETSVHHFKCYMTRNSDTTHLLDIVFTV